MTGQRDALVARVTAGPPAMGRAIAETFHADGTQVVNSIGLGAEIAPVTWGKVVGNPAYVRRWSD